MPPTKSLPQPLLPWLASLTTPHLKIVARATGTQHAGRKDALRERIRMDIAQGLFVSNESYGCTGKSKSAKKDVDEELSVLSIDMGIQNLAFAHLLVRPLPPLPLPSQPDMGGTTKSSGNAHQTRQKTEVLLNAWHRVRVQDLTSLMDAERDGKDQRLPSSAFRTLTARKTAASGRKKSEDTASSSECQDEQSDATEKGEEEEESANKSFDPGPLANNAYTLLSGLIAQYKPTHILIERQRFRTGGQSAVLEWSLRVGVFEGMLHAVLCTMRRLRVCEAAVWDVSPARVVQFWTGFDGDEKKEKEKVKDAGSKSIKKMKIDIVGRWLSQASSPSSSSSSAPPHQEKPISSSIMLDSSPAVHDTVTAYLNRWSGKKRTDAGASSSSSSPWRIEKLDDLADCLLQGLTWLEWQIRRAQLAADDGIAELARMGVDINKQKKSRRRKS